MIEYFNFAYKSMFLQKSRTILTLLGIIVGIAVIVSMISIGEGLSYSINEQLDMLGGDKITVFPSAFGGGGFGASTEFVAFKARELRDLERIPGVKSVMPGYYIGGEVLYRSELKDAQIFGFERSSIDVFSSFYSIEKGRFFEDYETDTVVIGYKIQEGFFERDVNIGSSIEINGRDFKVVGVLKEIGSQQDDTIFYLPLKTAQDLGDTDDITFIYVVAENEKIVPRVAIKIEDTLEKLRGGKDFEVQTTEEMAEQVGQVVSIITFVLGGIASVSIVVGGIIVMNTMLMAVMERTNEIGVMKATGATNKHILLVFLAESSLVGMIGGLVGIIFGFIISKAIQVVGQIYIGGIFTTVISKELVIGALVFSLFLGIISGVYPAWKAAQMSPVEALRYE